MTLYGFNKSDADQLVKVARREGQRPRNKASVKYPEASGISLFIGKTDTTINKGTANTVSRYGATSTISASTDLQDTGTNDTVFNLFANVGSGKWCIYVGIGQTLFMIAAEC